MTNKQPKVNWYAVGLAVLSNTKPPYLWYIPIVPAGSRGISEKTAVTFANLLNPDFTLASDKIRYLSLSSKQFKKFKFREAKS